MNDADSGGQSEDKQKNPDGKNAKAESDHDGGGAKKPGDEGGDKASKDGNDSQGDKDGGKPKKPSPFQKPKVRIGLAVLAVVCLVAFAFWFHHYWTVGRYQESTNDAYLAADLVSVAPKVPGYVERVFVQDNQDVRAGDPLVLIDPRDARAKAEQAQAQVDQGLASIASTEAQIRQQGAQIAVADAQAAGARQTLAHAQSQADRYGPLTERGAHSAEQLEQVLQQRDQAASQLAVARAQADAARRQTGSLQAQIGSARAQIEQARASQRQAEADLSSTLVRASIDGRIGDRTVRVGQFVQTGTKMMSVVPVTGLYLVANFKETQVGLMRVGQPATVKVDALSGSEMNGTVQSFAPGTGSQFALLPPQNATGNFTKVVQRVPVRIALEAGTEARRVLVPGLSVEVSVDTLGARQEHEEAKAESRNAQDRREEERKRRVQSDRERNRDKQQKGPGQ